MAMVYAVAAGGAFWAAVWVAKAANRARVYRCAAAVAGRAHGWLTRRAAACPDDRHVYGCAGALETGYGAPQRSEVLRSWLDLH